MYKTSDCLVADPYAFLENMDEASAVDSILQHMLNKKLVKDHVTDDLGLNDWSKYKDPRTKMQLRHQQVCIIHVHSDETIIITDN